VFVAFHLVDALMGSGPLADLGHAERRAFLRDRRPVRGVGLSRTEGAVTRVTRAEVDRLDWLPGTVAEVYALPADLPPADRLAQVAIKDHLGRRLGLHPADVHADVVSSLARTGGAEHPLIVRVSDGVVEVRDAFGTNPAEG